MYDYSRRRTATLDSGPVGRVLLQHWNTLHDIEHDLQQTLREYGDAAHFMGGPAEHAAKDMIRRIEQVAKELEHVSKHTFNMLSEAEAAFVGKYGEPGAYADKMRSETFPR